MRRGARDPIGAVDRAGQRRRPPSPVRMQNHVGRQQAEKLGQITAGGGPMEALQEG